MTTNANTASDPFFREYTSDDAILKYTKATAGYGISYLLDHDYKTIYLEALNALPPEVKRQGIRILEFGCGGGMNLVHLVSVLQRSGVRVEAAIGTDFSPVLIEAAKREATSYLREDEVRTISFHVANNDTLMSDLVASTGSKKAELTGSFHMIIGVNTMRYSHRSGKAVDCAKDILDLLIPGGVCVNIDMNDKFPMFRDDLKQRVLGRTESPEDCYLPSLSEYTTPFNRAGFDVLRSEHFCWIPHSSGPAMCRLLSAVSPLLNVVAGSRAMRSLVVAKKPANRAR